jgi:hypothetical protein
VEPAPAMHGKIPKKQRIPLDKLKKWYEKRGFEHLPDSQVDMMQWNYER